jgi:hypothetical protein
MAKRQRLESRRRHWQELKQMPRKLWLKPALTFAVLVAVIVIPMKFYDTLRFFSSLEGRLTNLAQAAVGRLDQGKEAALARDLNEAQMNFSQARLEFERLQTLIKVNREVGFFATPAKKNKKLNK